MNVGSEVYHRNFEQTGVVIASYDNAARVIFGAGGFEVEMTCPKASLVVTSGPSNVVSIFKGKRNPRANKVARLQAECRRICGYRPSKRLKLIK